MSINLPLSAKKQQQPADTLWKQKRFLILNSFGVVVPVGPFARQQQPGFAQSIGLEYFVSPSVFTRFNWDVNTTGKRSETLSYPGNGGADIAVQYGGFSYNTVSLNIGYRHSTKGSFAPYGFVGVGASFINAPQIRINYTTRSTIADARNGVAFNTQIGAGLKYTMQPYYLLRRIRGKSRLSASNGSRATYVFYLESVYQRFWGSHIITDTDVRIMPITLGVKISL
jgi:opacity protein-like surface antigen